ncbi:hypothetical protein TWF730_004225 [Orbilia blumenaviensis]|uniref:GLEYA adhesin domain-containing protein n=1 Tax=Orbilia blumenaviensis TaxID=1796055 RepID=A0AAV9TZK7_9PEZI
MSAPITVRASAFPTRQGAADCSSFLRTTVTPAVVTVTATNTEYATASATQDATATSTVYETVTETIHRTATELIPATVTVQNTAYEDLVKRQQTEIPSDIPTYAYLCSGAARYSSACSCVGVTATTITLPASTVTVSADETITQTTVTTTITVTTNYVTVVDATNTIETTDATLTQTTIVATATDTVRIPLSARFAIQVQGSQYDGYYAHMVYERSGLSFTPSGSGDIFSLTDGVIHHTQTGSPITGISSWLSNPSIRHTFLFFDTYNTIPWPFALIGDAIKAYDPADASIELKLWGCDPDPVNQFLWVYPVASYSPGPNFARCKPITLKAVKVPF